MHADTKRSSTSNRIPADRLKRSSSSHIRRVQKTCIKFLAGLSIHPRRLPSVNKEGMKEGMQTDFDYSTIERA